MSPWKISRRISSGYTKICNNKNLSKKFSVTGFDINKNKILQLKHGIDNDLILDKNDLKRLSRINLTYDSKVIRSSNVYIICVPTPVLSNKLPDLSLLKHASQIVGKAISNKDLVIFESTVFP